MTMGDRKVYDNYDLGMLEGFVFHDGIVKGDPMMDIIDEVFGNKTVFPHDQKNSKKMLNIGISNVVNGTFVSFNDNFKTRDLLHVLKASISYPGVFSPYEAWDSTWFSGSSIWGVDVSAPILRCKSKGFKEEDIVIDAIIDSDTSLNDFDAAKSNAI
jgi:predicted acylesterase/phospholipase RssA